MPRDPTETSEGKCEFCGEGPECAVCGRGRPATVARPEHGIPAVVRKAQDAGLRVLNYYRRDPSGPMTLVVADHGG
jgi:hypothetical protein